MEKTKQSRSLTIKIIVLICVAVVSMAVMAVLLSSMQTQLYLESCTSDMQTELSELPEELETAAGDVEFNTETFDGTIQSLAESVAFMANHDTGFAATHAKMQEYKDILNVDNVMVVKKDGTIVAQATDTLADFGSSRFNRLRTVFDDGKPSEPVEIELDSKDWLMRYYAARIDDETMIVIEQDPETLRELIQETGSTSYVLENVDIGQSGFMFAISDKDYIIEYYPDASLIGTDSIEIGVDVAELEDGNYTELTVNGKTLYCGISKIGDMYYIAAVPESDMVSSRNITVTVILVAFFLVMLVVVLYGIFVMQEDERQGVQEENIRKAGPFRFNKEIVRKSAVLSFIGLLAILVVSFYMQTLFSLSSQSVSNDEHINDIVATMDRSDDRIEQLSDQYIERYLPTCRVVGYILDQNPDLMNRNDLQELADILQVQTILVYNSNSKLTATNSAYTDYTLTTDEEDGSGEFLKLLQGTADSVVQDPIKDESTDMLWQYIGVPLHDADGNVSGLVQIAVRPTLLENFLDSTDIKTILDGVKTGTGTFVFAVNKEDNTFAYFPLDEQIVGDSVFDHGMTENELKGYYNDYLTVLDNTYYTSSGETDDYYIYLAGNEGELMNERLPLTVITGVIALVCLLIVFVLMIFEPKRNLREREPKPDDDSSEHLIDVEMPGGRKIKTEAVASRWTGRSIKWSERTAWQKTVLVLECLLAVFVVLICLVVLLKDSLFDSNSIFAYILGNNWERGLNVFAITACIMFICVAMTVVVIAQRLLRLLASILNAKGETICRLLSSFLKYATIIGMIYYCLTLFGVPAGTLLASAGILSLAVSLGARDLISDILSGLFIIFEGEFRVGDIITVGDWRGTVMEIGIRTTKVEDASQNVKAIRNSEVNDVVNMTKKLSFISCNYGIEYDESLEHVESILAKELPLIPERLPAIAKGPFYRGVTSLGENSVNIRISMQCLEADRLQLERDFNREMKLLFDKYEINIPFPQVVVNQPAAHKKATEYEKWRAEKFNEEQKESLKETGENENEN